MTDYRVDLVGSDGHFESSRTFVCDTDKNAVVWAKQMVGQQPAELWSGTRQWNACPSCRKTGRQPRSS